MKTGARPTIRRRQLSASRLRETYDRDYYHGVTSGYPSEGYGDVHPDWAGWLHFIRGLIETGRLLDLGCAYGYLVEAAEKAGYQALGVDVSRWALGREPRLAGRLIEGRLEQLPLQDSWADVVCLFDVLEHLPDPHACLVECDRVLNADGLIAGATPDPLRFGRDEPTHIYERPPSYWLGALQDLGFEARFRFSEDDYNFQFLAARRGSETHARLQALQQGTFSEANGFIETTGPLQAAPRDGWLSGDPPSRPLSSEQGSIYLLNPTGSPLNLSVELELSTTPGFSTLQLRLDSVVLAEVQLSTEETSYELALDSVPLAAGGHHLWFGLHPQGPQVTISRLRIQSESLEPDALAEGLPFDLYQRYRLASAVVEALQPRSILDVGGVLGDAGGHLAASADFLGAGRLVATTDLRHCDHPAHEIADAGGQPFGGRSFDLVVSLDVLEHLPTGDREPFLEELRRVADSSVVLGAPVADPRVQDAEERLGASLLEDHGFLGEHAEMGLPEAGSVRTSFEEAGWAVFELPNGYLPHWFMAQALTQVVFAARDGQLWRNFNRLYNRHFFPLDQQEPAYRRFWIASRQPLEDSVREQLARLVVPAEGKGLEAAADDAELIDLLMRAAHLGRRRAAALSAAQFIANARDEGLQILRRELEETPLSKLALRRFRKRRGQ